MKHLRREIIDSERVEESAKMNSAKVSIVLTVSLCYIGLVVGNKNPEDEVTREVGEDIKSIIQDPVIDLSRLSSLKVNLSDQRLEESASVNLETFLQNIKDSNAYISPEDRLLLNHAASNLMLAPTSIVPGKRRFDDISTLSSTGQTVGNKFIMPSRDEIEQHLAKATMRYNDRVQADTSRRAINQNHYNLNGNRNKISANRRSMPNSGGERKGNHEMRRRNQRVKNQQGGNKRVIRPKVEERQDRAVENDNDDGNSADDDDNDDDDLLDGTQKRRSSEGEEDINMDEDDFAGSKLDSNEQVPQRKMNIRSSSNLQTNRQSLATNQMRSRKSSRNDNEKSPANEDESSQYNQENDDEVLAASQKYQKHSVKDLQTAAGHHSGHHDHYYQYVEVPKKKSWKFGFKRGNHKHTIKREEHGHKNKFHSSFKWHALEKCKKKKKCESKGKMTWEYKHHDKKHHH